MVVVGPLETIGINTKWEIFENVFSAVEPSYIEHIWLYLYIRKILVCLGPRYVLLLHLTKIIKDCIRRMKGIKGSKNEHFQGGLDLNFWNIALACEGNLPAGVSLNCTPVDLPFDELMVCLLSVIYAGFLNQGRCLKEKTSPMLFSSESNDIKKKTHTLEPPKKKIHLDNSYHFDFIKHI